MIVAQRKPFDEIKSMLEDYQKIFILGCACAGDKLQQKDTDSDNVSGRLFLHGLLPPTLLIDGKYSIYHIYHGKNSIHV